MRNELRPNGLIFHHLEPERRGRPIQQWLMRLCSPPGRMRDREGGRRWWEGGQVGEMAETKMDAGKDATARSRGGYEMRE